MKKLSMFTTFNWLDFAKGKRFLAIGKGEWKDFDTGEHLGTKVEAVIAEDNTTYGNQNGDTVTNLYEKLTFKLRKDIDVPLNIEIVPKGVTAIVYGDYRNQLSCTAEDIVFTAKS